MATKTATDFERKTLAQAVCLQELTDARRAIHYDTKDACWCADERVCKLAEMTLTDGGCTETAWWNDAQRTAFIETIILGMPVPAVTVLSTGDGSSTILDGFERFRTMKDFRSGEMELTADGLLTLTKLAGARWDDLPAWVQRRFDAMLLRMVVYDQTTTKDVAADVRTRANAHRTLV